MKDWQLRSYHRLPYPGRVLIASLRGLYLKRWRYGPETRAWAAAALDRESWSAGRWREWQRERRQRVLERAVRAVPHYRRLVADGRIAEASAHEDWPVLTKEELRRSPEEFLADDCDPRRMFAEHTSGTTGTPLRLCWSRETTRRWYAMNQARLLNWNGADPGDRWALLGGQLVAAPTQTRPPFWVWNAPMRQLYLSAYHLTATSAPAYLEALRRYRVNYLLGYPSAIGTLASLALEGGLDVPRILFVATNAEPLLHHQRQSISAAFGCPVRETYGLAEIVCAASECEAGALHLWPEVGSVEILADSEDRPVPRGEHGRLVCTGLLNADVPLVRYDTGDRARFPAERSACECGRKLPVLERIEGRSDDLVTTPDGRTVGRLDPVFKAELPIREAQIVQERLDALVVRVVTAEGFGAQHEAEILARLADRVGEAMELRLEQVERISRGAAGKFKAVVSLVD